MNKDTLINCYSEFRSRYGYDANYLFTGGALADAIPLAAFREFAKENGIELSGIILNPYPKGQEQFLAVGELLKAAGHECCIAEPFFYDTNLLSRSVSLFNKTLATISRLSKVKDMDQDVSAWELKDPFFLLAPSDGYISPYIVDFLFGLGRPIVYVFMDDCAGTYARNNHQLAMRGADRIHNRVVRGLAKTYVYLSRPFSERLQYLFEHKALFRIFTLFNKNEDSFKINEKVKDLYVSVLKKSSEESGIEVKDYSNTVLIAATKAEIFGLEDIELKGIRKIRDYCNELGMKVIVRPHPLAKGNKRYEELGVEIEDPIKATSEANFSTAEALPTAVVGFASSVQVNANAYFDIPAISMECLVKEELEKASKGFPPVMQFLENINKMKAMYPDLVMFPDDERDFKERLARCK